MERVHSLPGSTGSAIPPGHLVARCPMDIVQIDHTLADLILVDDAFRRPIGRPWLSVALDVSTRCVVGVYVGMDRPNAATVALLLTRVVLPKAGWLASLDVSVDWPMHGIPQLPGSVASRRASSFRRAAQRREIIDLLGGRTLAPAHRFRISTSSSKSG